MKKSILVLLTSCTFAGQAGAEELYDFACCPNDDCQQADVKNITTSQTGFRIDGLDELIHFDDPRIRPSRDGNFHICTRATATPELTQSQIFRLDGKRTLKCLYVPAMG